MSAATNAQETGTLLERLGAESTHLEQLLAALEGAMFITVSHYVLGQGLGEAGDPGQQRYRGGIHIHTDRIHAIFHHGIELAGQLALTDIMLILAHPYALGIYLDQLGQGILQAAGDGDGAADGDIKTRKLLGGELGGGVDGGTRLADHDLLSTGLRVAFEQFSRQAIRLAEAVPLPILTSSTLCLTQRSRRVVRLCSTCFLGSKG